MILYKIRAKKKSKPKFLGGLLGSIYSVISFVYLQYPLLVGLIGLILWLTGVFNDYPVSQTVFYVVFGLSIFASIVLTIKRLFSPKKKKKEKDSEEESQAEETVKVESVQTVTIPKTERWEMEAEMQKAIKYPIYYKVKQNPDYVFAEYEDRYELYFNSVKGLIRVRTDYKN